jgi:hypothetical protein
MYGFPTIIPPSQEGTPDALETDGVGEDGAHSSKKPEVSFGNDVTMFEVNMQNVLHQYGAHTL